MRFSALAGSSGMLAITAAVIATTLLLPRSPLAALLGFSPAAPACIVLVFTIAVACLVSAKLAKGFFYRLHPPEAATGAARR